MTERDPLSPASLAAVPEVREAFEAYDRDRFLGRDSEYVSERYDNLLLAVRDATLKAERERLLALTPEAVVEAAAKAMKDAEFEHGLGPSWNAAAHLDYYRACVRAALPVLLAPEVARREAAEREVLGWSGRATTAEAEVGRLREALEKFGNAPCVGTDENNDTCGVTFTCQACRQNAEIRAALGGAK